jgi:predicted ribosomally synthesized peptide with nif11-like leader
MSDDQLKAFLKAVHRDESLQQKLKGPTDPEAVVAIAKEAGFVVSVKEITAFTKMREISDEELADVAGGWGMFSFGSAVEKAVRNYGTGPD